ncbi:hypothetical protein CCP3SC1AL1_540001 [Gammaproteobacteria bacterium]
MGQRISEIQIKGKPLEEKREYLVAGWASVQEQPESSDDIWDVVSRYLREKKHLRIERVNTPKLKNVQGNPGIAQYSGQILS